MKSLAKELIRLADRLDSSGLSVEADLVDRLCEAMTRYASVTFSLGHEHGKKIVPELDKHKSARHKEIEKELDKRQKELSSRWKAFKYVGDESRRAEAFYRANPDLDRDEDENLRQELYDHEVSPQYSSKKQELDPEMNLANGNARALLEALGYDAGDLMGSLNVNDLMRRIVKFKNSASAKEQAGRHTRAPSDTGGPGTGHARVMDMGLSHEQMESYITRLEKLASQALASGVQEISYS